ncbi:fungal specific transcription factor domain-containing protein [Aspergillus melleus]|uniref:fungal specific transcription factor domain-containing protein n=1 Tax=Aspergillus melleus TaxID=138277 RepID=UPI001E8D4E30|nr:uncharacterized protein LDX57_001407 [Aspergillus melleus]KAH8423648.1 hypothetical protein LDX57_001407 [Aspergillus melleus]
MRKVSGFDSTSHSRSITLNFVEIQFRKNIVCEYVRLGFGSSSVSAAASDPEWFSSPGQHNRPDTQSIDFPTLVFLDPGHLRHGQVEIERTAPPVPTHILRLLGDMDEIRDIAARFFEHIHRWMPFISKKQFYKLHLQPTFSSQANVALLLLSLKLITTILPIGSRSPRSALYYTVKHFHLEVEGSSDLSMQVLQAGVLISLYELGHGNLFGRLLDYRGMCSLCIRPRNQRQPDGVH